ncbi:Sulfatase [Roseivivax lentus]|uniref:Sulfatase n=1 Tax=Roseivivax lentus TaxID=633194 RepID=A0A1N7KCA7_9RHOB|nr:sulfatase-like hydrolase/transferase [Roseivivax lentus]SIS59248.1 Sulfatase [Roseivivax lentus]
MPLHNKIQGDIVADSVELWRKCSNAAAVLLLSIFTLQSVGVIFFGFPKLASIVSFAFGTLISSLTFLTYLSLRSHPRLAHRFLQVSLLAIISFQLIIALIYALSLAAKAAWGNLVTLKEIEPYLSHSGEKGRYLLEIVGQNGLYPIAALILTASPALLLGSNGSANRIISKLLSRKMLISGLIFSMLVLLMAPKGWKAGSPLYYFFSSPRFNAAMGSEDHKRAFESGYLSGLQISDYDHRPIFLITVDAMRADFALGENESSPSNFLSVLREHKNLVYEGKINATCTSSYCGIASIFSAEQVGELNVFSDNLVDVLESLKYQTQFILSGDHLGHYRLKEVYRSKYKLFFDGNSSQDFSINDDRLLFEGMDLVGEKRADDFYYFHLMSPHGAGKIFIEGASTSRNRSLLQRIIGWQDEKEFAANYLLGLRQAEGVINEIFRFIEGNYLGMKPLVIVTSDHGELLGEGGRFGHGGEPAKELIEIPIFIIDYGAKSQRMNLISPSLQSQSDIAPFILRSLGVPLPDIWSEK